MILFRIAAVALITTAAHAAQATEHCVEAPPPSPIALRITADPGSNGASTAAKTIEQVMTHDLLLADRTTVVAVPPAALSSPDVPPDFDALSQAGVRLAVAMKVASEPKNDVVVQLRIFDVQSRTQVLGEQLRTYTHRTRSLAHSFADLVLSKLGAGPMFDTRIAAIVENKDAAPDRNGLGR